ncbi:Hypothetical predicted protein [Podarcis lilfordi]|uniref:Uncharacterized protein n=1 Tax=Podarcis lilfordi TaxID=74358 RepID=A0AA35PG33_9SAUR|nr:Hypothetical predicted protein [Podarcis lilfordi]
MLLSFPPGAGCCWRYISDFFYCRHEKRKAVTDNKKKRDHPLWFIKVRTTHQDDGGQQQEAPKIVKPLNYDVQLRNTGSQWNKRTVCGFEREEKIQLAQSFGRLPS